MITLPLDVAGGAADRLDQRRLAAEEALLVGVDDRDERHLGQVEPLAQQVHAHEHVELAQPQVADDLDPLERVDLRVQVADPEAVLEQVVGEVLGHLLRERGDQRALAGLGASADLVHQVVDLVLGLAHLDLAGPRCPSGARSARRSARSGCARTRPAWPTRTRSAGDVGRNSSKVCGPVVQRARQPEAVVHERLLARAVALVHAADLRHRLVRLVDEARRSRPGRSRAGSTAGRPAGGRRGCASSSRFRCRSRARASSPCRTGCAGAGGATRAACPASSSSLQRASSSSRISSTARSIVGAVGGVVRGRPDADVLELRVDLAGERVEVLDRLDLVAEEDGAVGGLRVGREDLERLAADAEGAAAERRVVARVRGCPRACAGSRRGRPSRPS